jgi:O-antigen ligase
MRTFSIDVPFCLNGEKDAAVCRNRRLEPASLTGLCIITSILCFSPLIEGGTTHLAVMGVRLLILLLLTLFLWKSIYHRRLEWPVLPIGTPLMIFLAFAVGSAASSEYANQSWQWLLVLLSYALLLYLVAAFVTEWDHVRNLVTVIVIGGVGEAGWALWQGLVWNAQRPHGTFFNPNFLAGYLCVSCVLLLGSLVCVRFRRRGCESQKNSHPVLLLGMLGLLAMLLCALLWTGSRGGLVAMMAGTGIVLTLRFGLRRAATVVVAIFMVLLLIPNPIRERALSEHTANAESYARWHMWQRSLEVMIDHPFGIGLGLYQYIFPRYAFPVEGQIARYGKIAETPHNEYLQIGVELGIGALAVFLWAVVGAGKRIHSLLTQRLTRRRRGAVIGFSGAAGSILVHAALDSNLHEPAIAILLTVCVGILLGAASFTSQKSNRVTIIPMKSRPVWTALAASVVLALGIEVVRLGVAWSAYDTGTRHSSQHQTAATLSKLQLAAVLDPGKALYHRALAGYYVQHYERTGDVAAARAAVRELEVATQLNPLDGRLHALLGSLYARWSSLSPADSQPEHQRTLRVSSLHAYQRASELAPYVASYRFEQARLYMSLGDAGRAEESARQVLEFEPNYLPARAWLAGLYFQLKRMDEADKELKEIEDRQQRYAGWPKNQLEETFLTVDLTQMRAMLDRRHTSG